LKSGDWRQAAALTGQKLADTAGPDSFNVLPAILGGKLEKPSGGVLETELGRRHEHAERPPAPDGLLADDAASADHRAGKGKAGHEAGAHVRRAADDGRGPAAPVNDADLEALRSRVAVHGHDLRDDHARDVGRLRPQGHRLGERLGEPPRKLDGAHVEVDVLSEPAEAHPHGSPLTPS
jgi:hypothetical protein